MTGYQDDTSTAQIKGILNLQKFNNSIQYQSNVFRGNTISHFAVAFSLYSNLQLFTTGQQSLLQAFETVLAYIPDEAPRLTKTTVESHPTWFAKALEFSTANSLPCSARLFAMSAAVYDKLSNDNEDNEYYNFKPNVLIELNQVVEAENRGIAVSVAAMTDTYLFRRAQHMSIDSSQFASVLKSTAWCLRPSFDSTFDALEEMLLIFQDNGKQLSPTEISEMITEVDFTRLSPSALDRAARNELIPQRVTMMAAVKVCSQLHFQLAEKTQQLQETVTSLNATRLMTQQRLEKLEAEKKQLERKQRLTELNLEGERKVVRRLKQEQQQILWENTQKNKALAEERKKVGVVEQEKKQVLLDLKEIKEGWMQRINGSWRKKDWNAQQRGHNTMEVIATVAPRLDHRGRTLWPARAKRTGYDGSQDKTLNISIKRSQDTDRDPYGQRVASYGYCGPPQCTSTISSATTEMIHFVRLSLTSVEHLSSSFREFPFLLIDTKNDELWTPRGDGCHSFDCNEFSIWEKLPPVDTSYADLPR